MWGQRHGVCRDCRRATWYFNRKAFEPEGAGVVFRQGRVVARLHALAAARLADERRPELGVNEAEIGTGQVLVGETACRGYTAQLSSTGKAQTVYYVYDGQLWGFGLIRSGANPCL